MYWHLEIVKFEIAKLSYRGLFDKIGGLKFFFVPLLELCGLIIGSRQRNMYNLGMWS
jgi:hypothetical protein